MNLFDLAVKISLDNKSYIREIDDAIEKTDGFSEAMTNLRQKYNESQARLSELSSALRKLASDSNATEKDVSQLSYTLTEEQEYAAELKAAMIALSNSYLETSDAAQETSDSADKLAESEDDVAENAEEADEKTSKFAETLKNGLSVAAKASAAAIAAASAAIGALITSSVEQYAEYQQSVGGIEKLYGTAGLSLQEYADSVDKTTGEAASEWAQLLQAQTTVLQNADEAYKTTGMSANQYMEMATSFSGSLISSLEGNTLAAADSVQLAMQAISDNWNTFGGDIGMIQGAFRGFARQNYAMLDNLQLGYGQGKEEMERLIADANEYAESIGEASNLSIDSFADIVTAIDLVQQKQHIAGTTAREASTTISGSVGMVKAAWENLVTGLSNNKADIGQLFANLVESAEIALSNLAPVVETALVSVGTLIDKVVPVVEEKLPILINMLLPPLLSAATTLITGLLSALPSVLSSLGGVAQQLIDTVIPAILAILPEIINSALTIVITLADSLTAALPELIPAVVSMVMQIVETLTEPETLTNLVDAALALILALSDGLIAALPILIAQTPVLVDNLVNGIVENYPKIVRAGYQLIYQLVAGILAQLPSVVTASGKIVSSIQQGVVSLLGELVMLGKDLVDTVKNGFSDKVEDARQWGRDLISNFISGITQMWTSLKNTVSNVASTIKGYLGFSEPEEGPLSDFHTYAPDMIDLWIKGIRDNVGRMRAAMSEAFNFEDELSQFSGVDIGADGISLLRGVTIVQNIYSEAKTAADLMQEARYQAEQEVLAGVFG